MKWAFLPAFTFQAPFLVAWGKIPPLAGQDRRVPNIMSPFFAHPQFLKKSPSKIRPLKRRGDLMGFRAEKFGSSS